MPNLDKMDELDKKLEWIKKCRCSRAMCLAEREKGTHDQSKTGCPSCDFAHANYPLFSNKEVLALINRQVRGARIEELRNVDCGDDDDDEQLVQWAFEHMYSTMDGRSINGRIKHLEELTPEEQN